MRSITGITSRIRDWFGQMNSNGTRGEAPANPEANRAGRLVDVVNDAELFHTPDGETFATVSVDGHRQTWALESSGFGTLLRHRYYQTTGRSPSAASVNDAIGTLKAKAQFDGESREVHTRVAGANGKVYLDLANDRWEAVEISTSGWKTVANPPVRFRRSRGTLALPIPQEGGSLDDLRAHINAPDETTWVLCLSWLVFALYPKGPYPVLILQGEQGSAKSTTARMLSAMVDPNSASLRTQPKSEQDLLIWAKNTWVIVLDNLSRFKSWFSDALCRLATGAGFSTRKLYSDADETIIEAQRPAILTGIEDLAIREDLIDRSLIVYLPQIRGNERRTEDETWQAFEEARPGILGALCDVLSVALRNQPGVKLDFLPRMADFAKLIAAAEGALPWPSGTFRRVYQDNRDEAIERCVQDSPVASAVRAFANTREWKGTATELLVALDNEEYTPDKVRKSSAWPKTPNWLSGRLKRAATFLREVGVAVEFTKGKDRLITIRRAGKADQLGDAKDAKDAKEHNCSSEPKDMKKKGALTPI